ncbi:MAG: elongation factor G [Deltaproteobacteria bacterium]|nr:elongation factor G [Deltaproteobacteria bacterium]
MAAIDQLRNIGIAAHIDAGKTTLTERILFLTGVTRRLGEVHDGEATMDFMKQEQERGITITSAAISCRWEDWAVNIIDTPGHVDFTIEVERSLRVIDGMVAVFSSVDGVEPQSETVWNQAERYRVPRLAFINKMDREGADFAGCLRDMNDRLDAHTVAMQVPIGAGSTFYGVIDLISLEAELAHNPDDPDVQHRAAAAAALLVDEAEKRRHDLIERLAELDAEVMDLYVHGKEPSPEQLWRAAREATLASRITPVLCGAAYKNLGIRFLLDAVGRLLPSPVDVGAVSGTDPDNAEVTVQRRPLPDEPLSALAFKIMHDPYVGQQTFTRIYSGTLTSGQPLFNATQGKRERAGRILRIRAKDREELEKAGPGEIVALIGVKGATTGDTLCDPDHPLLLEKIHVPVPVISMAVKAPNTKGEEALGKALHRIALEDPSFIVRTDEETAETIIAGMGELHLEIIVDRLRTDFGVEVVTSAPKVAYRETMTQPASINHRLVKQTGGKGQFAHVVLRVEPNPQKGFEFVSEVVGGRVPREFVPAIEEGCELAVADGVLAGFPVVDVKVVLEDGSFHAVDSSEMAFKICASQAFKAAFMQGGPQLLEPMMKLEIVSPEEYVGDIHGDVNRRRGRVTGMDPARPGLQKIHGEVPLAEMFGYTTTLRSLSSGRASSSMEFLAYSPLPAALAQKVIAANPKRRGGRAGDDG